MPPHRPLLALCAGVAAFSLSTTLGSQAPIRWRAGAELLAPTDTPATQAVLLDALRAGERHVVLQLGGRATARVRQALGAAGVTLSSYAGGDAWFAEVSPLRLDPLALSAVSELRGVARIERAWKLHPLFAGGQAPAHARVGGSAEDPVVAAYAVFHPDQRVEGEVPRALVQNQGGRVMDTLESVNALVIELPLARLDDLAGADAVQWIEPPLPRMGEVALPNDSNRTRVQADLAQAAPYGLDGAGVTVLVYDAGIALASHQDFGGRLTTHDGSGLLAHSTHVSGTIGGSGTASGGTFRGMAPGVLLRSFGFEYDGTSIFLYTNPGDLESDYNAALNTLGADVANNSIGSNTETNGFPCNIQGDYGVCESLIDAIVRGSLGAPFPVVWADGNERQGSNCDVEGFGDYYSTAPPATAKNHIAVGALNSNDDSMTSFSSWGPTDDGRLRPDVSAPGCQSNGDSGVTSASSSSSTSYTVLCGTSMAAPTVAGCVALMLEDFRAVFPGLPDPRNATLKVLLAQTAVDLGNAGPDYQFGFGSVRAKDAIDFQRLGRFDEEVVPDQGAAFVYSVAVTGGAPLKLTLAWDDVPGTPNVAGALVNDLDLVVFDPLGARRYPWTLNPQNPSAAAVKTQADHANNLEQVLVDGPLAGAWRVEVHGFDVASGPQPFSLCSSHPLAVAPFVQIGFPDGLPATVAPGLPTPIRARIQGFGQTLVAGSPALHYRMAGGAFQSVPMSSVGPDLYQALLPAALCTDTPQFYVAAAGGLSGAAVNPAGAPATSFAVDVESLAVVFADDFETDKGWTVTSTSLTDGPWERGIPAGDGGRNDPLADFDGSGRCWLTDNVSGNSDVDGGPTTVTSPLIDMSQPGTYLVRYAVWFANDDFDVDDLDVAISNDAGASWTPVESLKNTSGWLLREFDAGAFGATTGSMRVRFSATDNPNDSVTEAALDAFEVVRVTCGSPGVIAAFAGAPTSGLAPLAVSFTDLSTGPIQGWDWSFGDGGASTAQHPSHTYQMPGTYSVTLDVAGPSGSDSLTKLAYVQASKPPRVGTPFGAGSPGPLGQPTIAAHSLLAPGAAFYLVGGNLPPGTPSYLAISLHQLAPPLDLTGGLVLNLNVPLVLLVPAVANANGEALILVTLPAATGGASVYGQCIALAGTGGSAYAASQGLAVVLP